MQTNRCEGVGGIRADEFEALVLSQMIEHLKMFETLEKHTKQQENPKIQELNVKLEAIKLEIEKLLDKVSKADDILMEYINKRVSELDAQANVYRQQLAELSPLENESKYNFEKLRDYMQHWEDLSFDDKRAIVDQLIVKIRATEDTCEIIWKI